MSKLALLLCLFFLTGKGEAQRIAVKRISADFTGDGRAEALVFYQDKNKQAGHVTLYGRQGDKSVQLWKSPSLPLVEVWGEDVNGDHIAEIILFTARGDHLLDMKVLEYQPPSWQKTFQEIVSAPEDVHFFFQKYPVIELEAVFSEKLSLRKRRYEYREGKYLLTEHPLWSFQSLDKEEIKEITALESSQENIELLLLGKKQGATSFVPLLFNPRRSTLLEVLPPQSDAVTDFHWISKDSLAVTLCGTRCNTYLLKYPEGEVEVVLEGVALSGNQEQIFYKKPKEDKLSSYFLYNRKTREHSYFFDAEQALSYSRFIFLHFHHDPFSQEKLWYQYNFKEGKQYPLYFPVDPLKLIPFPARQGLLAFTAKELFFVFPEKRKEELWYVTEKDERIRDISLSPYSQELNIFLEKDSRVELGRFAYDSLKMLWRVKGIKEAAENEEGFFVSDGHTLFKKAVERFLPLLGGKKEKVRNKGKELYVIQIASSTDYKKALALYETLSQSEELKPYRIILAPKWVKGILWYAVQVGAFQKKEESASLQELLQKKGFEIWIARANLF